MITNLLLFFLAVLILFRRRIFPWLLMYFVHRLTKKMAQQQKHSTQTPPTPKNKSTNDLGDYIDYEEID